MSTMRGIELSAGFWFDILLRAVLAVLFIELEKAEPFTRKIHEDELWLYRNPRTDSYVPTTILWPLVFITPTVVICVLFLINKDKVDFCQAMLSVTLALGFNGVITNIIKLIVGRPRPDFFWRCFPDGQVNLDFKCTGNPVVIRDGRKSFPSGHSSFAFASFGFIALYLAGKLQTFNSSGKGQSWKLCIFFIPMCVALIIALSRTCDYHHHWQGIHNCYQSYIRCCSPFVISDVVIGSLIGFSLSYICYRHYYPTLDSQVCNKPYYALAAQAHMESLKTNRNEQMKWI